MFWRVGCAPPVLSHLHLLPFVALTSFAMGNAVTLLEVPSLIPGTFTFITNRVTHMFWAVFRVSGVTQHVPRFNGYCGGDFSLEGPNPACFYTSKVSTSLSIFYRH